MNKWLKRFCIIAVLVYCFLILSIGGQGGGGSAAVVLGFFGIAAIAGAYALLALIRHLKSD
jgi:hypothetical protein